MLITDYNGEAIVLFRRDSSPPDAGWEVALHSNYHENPEPKYLWK